MCHCVCSWFHERYTSLPGGGNTATFTSFSGDGFLTHPCYSVLVHQTIASCVLALSLAAGVAGVRQSSTPASRPDLSRHFQGINGTFVLLNATTGEYQRYNAARAAQRFPPCSTFKIPNTAILLESGVASGPDHLLKYDPALAVSRPEWAKDHTLRSAYAASVLWYYQALGRTAGQAVEDKFVRQFRYGNQNTSGGMNVIGRPFWVDGSLRISANEQVEFLKRLHEGALGLSERTTRLTKEIMIAETTPSWTLRGKTGACDPKGKDVSLWYVGSVEKKDATFYFALQMGDTSYDRLFSQRVTKARDILRDLYVLD
jgi:beta-lactamase class D